MSYKRTTPGGGVGLDNPSLTGLTTIGSGDDQWIYNSGFPGKVARVARGAAAAPVTTPDGPALKATTLQQVTRADLTAAISAGADGVEALSAVAGIAVGTVATEVQPVGLYGGAKSSSTVSGVTNDATGVYGVGRITGSGVGSGIGGFFLGRRDGSTGRANAAEFHCYNGGSAVAYSTTGFTNAQGLWINAGGGAESAAGIILANGFGRQFEVGLAFNAQVTNSLTGPTSVNDIRSDSTATTSVLIQGTHSTAAIAVAAGAGPVLIGGTSAVTAAKLEVQGPDAVVDPLVMIGSSSFTRGYSMRLRNNSGTAISFISGAVNEFLTGTVSGDAGLYVSGSKVLHLGRSGVAALRLSDSIGVFGTSFGDGVGVVFVANAGTDPTTNPTGGGILYVSGGALKFRGSSGTVTTVAVA